MNTRSRIPPRSNHCFSGIRQQCRRPQIPRESTIGPQAPFQYAVERQKALIQDAQRAASGSIRETRHLSHVSKDFENTANQFQRALQQQTMLSNRLESACNRLEVAASQYEHLGVDLRDTAEKCNAMTARTDNENDVEHICNLRREVRDLSLSVKRCAPKHNSVLSGQTFVENLCVTTTDAFGYTTVRTLDSSDLRRLSPQSRTSDAGVSERR